MQFQNKLKQNTHIVCLIGHPILHSFSPMMHNIAFDLSGLNYLYLPFDVPPASLKDAMRGVIALGIKGFNVTIPHKEKISEYLTNISEEAAVIGAVNTVVNENGKLNGCNTDVEGAIRTLSPYKEDISGQTVSIIGAGGASRSVIYALIRHFKVNNINIINRTLQKAESLCEYFSNKMHFENFKAYDLMPPDLVNILNNSKLIVNTTPVGMHPDTDDSPTTNHKSFNKDQIIFDVVYNPLKTKFLQTAEISGAKVVNGLTMLIEQGASSFELWTGEKMPVQKIYRTLFSYLSN